MANYCKKSSIEAVVSEVKTKAGISQSTLIGFDQIDDQISALVIPTQRGSPSVALTTSNTQHTISKGVYTGGIVSVTPQQGTAQPQINEYTLYPENGKVFSSVVIPASNVFAKASGKVSPTSSNKTTFTVSGLSFRPAGIIIVLANATKGVASPNIGAFMYKDGTVYGRAASSSVYTGVDITNATVSITNTSIVISNIVAGSTSLTFASSKAYAYFVWG